MTAPEKRRALPRGTLGLAALLVGALAAATLHAGEVVHWEGRFELGDTVVLLELEVTEPGQASAWLTDTAGRRSTAVEAFTFAPDEVSFRLPELERGYTFRGIPISPTRVEGALERVPPEIPSTDVYLVPIATFPEGPGESRWELGTPRNLTDREGYDNQPRFLPGGDSLLYTSIRNGQADIYRYDLESGALRQVTDTPESEYSPTPLPDGGGFSTVRVEADGTQRLWAFDLDGTHPRLLLPDIEPVGYHAWIDTESVALFVLGEPPTLEIAHLGSDETERVAEDIGRCLQPLPGRHRVLFVVKGPEPWMFAEAGPQDAPDALHLLRPTRAGREDFVATDSDLLMADGSALFSTGFSVDASADEAHGRSDWRQIADFGQLGIGDITRLALAPDRSRLALVAERPDPTSFPARIELALVRGSEGSE